MASDDHGKGAASCSRHVVSAASIASLTPPAEAGHEPPLFGRVVESTALVPTADGEAVRPGLGRTVQAADDASSSQPEVPPEALWTRPVLQNALQSTQAPASPRRQDGPFDIDRQAAHTWQSAPATDTSLGVARHSGANAVTAADSVAGAASSPVGPYASAGYLARFHQAMDELRDFPDQARKQDTTLDW
jgi:hypothetical protein